MTIPEGWPTKGMIDAADDPLSTISRTEARAIVIRALEAAPTPPAQGLELEPFDAGLLPDYEEGGIEWWQDAIRNLLVAAHEHYQEQVDNLVTPPAPEVEPVKPFWPPVQETIDSYLEDYELDDGEICHAPSPVETFLVKDAIAGLLNDDDFMAAFQIWVNAYQSYRDERTK